MVRIRCARVKALACGSRAAECWGFLPRPRHRGRLRAELNGTLSIRPGLRSARWPLCGEHRLSIPAWPRQTLSGSPREGRRHCYHAEVGVPPVPVGPRLFGLDTNARSRFRGAYCCHRRRTRHFGSVLEAVGTGWPGRVRRGTRSRVVVASSGRLELSDPVGVSLNHGAALIETSRSTSLPDFGRAT